MEKKTGLYYDGETYYLYPYITKKLKNKYRDNLVAQETIREYIVEKGSSWIVITGELFHAITKIVKERNLRENVGLICIPSSNKSKVSSVEKSIHMITELLNNEKQGMKLSGNRKFYDCSDMLKRTRNIRRNVRSSRALVESTQKRTIKAKTIADMDKMDFILIDDNKTRGQHLKICRDKLIALGIESENIYELVISLTELRAINRSKQYSNHNNTE